MRALSQPVPSWLEATGAKDCQVHCLSSLSPLSVRTVAYHPYLLSSSSPTFAEQLLEFMHQLPAFANMTMSVRRELCAVMVFAVVERAGTIVLNDGEEVGV